jgi:peptidoglycan hydrolase-like protein with peptidoglycan-binding domain
MDAFNGGDFKTAMDQAKLLAPLGNADAQFYLGKMYAEGKGTLQRNTHAHMWFNLASANGHSEAAQERDVLAGKMTPVLVDKAQDLAAACMDSDYQDCALGKKPQPNNQDTTNAKAPTTYAENDKAIIKASFREETLLRRKQIQYALRKLGYYSSSVDGLWGKGTERAIVNYGQNEKLSTSDTQGIFKSILSKVDVPSAFAVARKKTTDPLELHFEKTCKEYGHRSYTAAFNQCVATERSNYGTQQRLSSIQREAESREASQIARERAAEKKRQDDKFWSDRAADRKRRILRIGTDGSFGGMLPRY